MYACTYADVDFQLTTPEQPSSSGLCYCDVVLKRIIEYFELFSENFCNGYL